MIIAERRLVWKTSSQRHVDVRIMAPEQNPSDWSCLFEIDWPTGPESGRAYGVDAVQALILCLQMTASAIYASDYHKSGKLSFEEGVPGYGFPLPQGLRELAIGMDKKFFSG